MSYSGLILAWGVVAFIMLLLWLWQLKTENAGVVDVAWAYLTGIVAAVLLLQMDGGAWERRLLLAAMALLWGLRLGTYLYVRVVGRPEDGRYRYLRHAAGDHAKPVMLVFFQLQAMWVILFVLPYLAAAASGSPALGWLDLIGVVVWLCAMAGEVIADQQLHTFRVDPANRGKVCDVGLWRYSRHPNYFFEWMIWWAFVFIGVSSPWWWVTLAGVVVMYVFITRITGIPYTEKQALRSRGDAYRAYQRTTSAFFPLPPKHTASS